jgi:hypothetical protein
MNRTNESLPRTPTLAAGPGGVHVNRIVRASIRRLNHAHYVTNSRPALRWWTRH